MGGGGRDEGWQADWKNQKITLPMSWRYPLSIFNKNSTLNRPGPDARNAPCWYGRLRKMKLTLSVLNCADAPGQSLND